MTTRFFVKGRPLFFLDPVTDTGMHMVTVGIAQAYASAWW